MTDPTLAQIKEQHEVRSLFAAGRKLLGLDRDIWWFVAAAGNEGPDRWPDPDIVKAAEATRSFAAVRLGIEKRPPDVRWFRPLTEDEMRYVGDKGIDRTSEDLFDRRELVRTKRNALGAFDDDGWPCCWIRNDLDAEDAMAVALHETAHAAGMNETEAEAFENEWSNRLGLIGSPA